MSGIGTESWRGGPDDLLVRAASAARGLGVDEAWGETRSLPTSFVSLRDPDEPVVRATRGPVHRFQPQPEFQPILLGLYTKQAISLQ